MSDTLEVYWPTQHRRRAVFAMLGTLAFVELLARFVPPDAVAVPSIQSITLRKIKWLAEQPRPDVLIVGDSTGHRGISAEAYGAASGETVLNASITSGSPIIVRAMTENVPWKPARIVFTLSPFLLSDGWTAEPHEVDVATFQERYAMVGAGEAVLSTAWVTYRRRYLMKPTAKALLLGTAGATQLRDYGPRIGAEDRYGTVSVRKKKENFADAEAKWNAWTRETPTLGVRYAALESLVESWREDGVEVTFVLMPVHSSLRLRGEKDPETWSFSSRALRGLSGRVLDCRGAASDDAFYDSDHLMAGDERDRFSRLLATEISTGSGEVGKNFGVAHRDRVAEAPDQSLSDRGHGGDQSDLTAARAQVADKLHSNPKTFPTSQLPVKNPDPPPACTWVE